MSQDPQNPTIRRAYVVRAKPSIREHLEPRGEADLAETLSRPTVVMTEALPYDGKLESYRSLILGKLKAAFIGDLREFLGRDDCASLFGDFPDVILFDTWWVAEEADTIEIATSW